MRFDQAIKEVLTEDVIVEKNCVKLNSKDKTYVASLWDGTRIFLVDGAQVRNDIDVAFFGGTHPKYEDCKTQKEIWIEKSKGAQEEAKILVHEIVEYIMMKFVHMSYDRAHDIANSVENAVRKMSKR